MAPVMDSENQDRVTTFGDLLREGEQRLKLAGLPQPRWEAEQLLANAAQTTRLQLYVRLKETTPADGLQKARQLFKARASRTPLQYLIGVQEFWGLPFEVTPDVLIPRPETEILVEEVLKRFKDRNRTRPLFLLDVGTGSGCISIALAVELPGARFLASDLSWKALAVARRNARQLGVARQITFIQGDLLEPIQFSLRHERPAGGRVDAIICNPPYISSPELENLEPEVRDHEPRLALNGGPDGQEICRRVIAQAPDYLKSEGYLLMEVGYQQALPLKQWIFQAGLPWKIEIQKDLSGVERVLVLSKK